MSPLSPERYVAVLAPSAAGVWRRPRGGRLEALAAADGVGGLARHGEGEAGAEGGAGAPVAAWTAAVEALQAQLERAGVRRGELAVVLSGHLARMRLVPWSDAVGSPAELEAYARIGFEDVYGPAAAGWSLRVSPEAAGCPRLAVAVEQALIDRLQALVQRAGLRLASLQPHAVAAFNRLLHALPRKDFLFAAAEPGRCSVLVVRSGRWQSVRSTASDASDAAIVALVERECALDGLLGDAPPVYVHVAGRGRQAWPDVLGAAPEPLVIGDGSSPAGPWADMAMAAA